MTTSSGKGSKHGQGGVGTYVLFRCLDIAPDCFDKVPADSVLAGLITMRRAGSSIACRFAEDALAVARAHDVREPWVTALERELFKGRRLDDLERGRRVAEALRHRVGRRARRAPGTFGGLEGSGPRRAPRQAP